MSQLEGVQFDVTNCEKEPIHLVGAIQPMGYLLVLDRMTQKITQVSQNLLEKYNQIQFIDRKFDELFSIDRYTGAHDLWKRVQSNYQEQFLPLKFNECQSSYIGFIHQSHDKILVEFEDVNIEDASFNEAMLAESSPFHIDESTSLGDLLANAADEVQRVTQFDRVMIYKFDSDWNGDVVAESLRNGVDSYLDHHFPSSDIPSQARAIFYENWVRAIPDVNYKPIPIITAPGDQASATDLKRSLYRSVSPIHLQYLKNMAVEATLTISLKVEGRLWGLIACHHLSPKQAHYALRANAQSIGRLVSALIPTLEERDSQRKFKELQKFHDSLFKKMSQDDGVVQGLFSSTEKLLSLTASEGGGVALLFEGKWFTQGKVPANGELGRLAVLLKPKLAHNTIFQTSSVRVDLPEIQLPLDVVSGLLALKIPKEEMSLIIWFRPELISEVKWAGKPVKEVERLPDGSLKIDPRTSFETWKEEVRERSRSWTAPQIEAAELLRTSFIGLDLQRQFRLEQEARFASELAFKQMKASENRMNVLVNVMPQSIFILDSDRRIRFANQFFLNYFGLSQISVEMRSLDDLGLFVSGNARETFELPERFGGSRESRHILRNRNGQRRWNLFLISPLNDEETEQAQFICTLIDIHDQYLLDEERRLRANIIGQLFEKFPMPFFSTDSDFKLIYHNPQARNLFLKVDLPYGQNILHYIGVDPLEVKAILARGDFFEAEFKVLPHFWYHIYGYNAPSGYAFACIDVTERVKYQEDLLEARDQAEKANSAKSMFLANMSHEIRTPLGVLLGYMDVLTKTKDEEKRATYLSTMQRNATYLLDLVNDILDLSKIAAGKIHLEKTETDLLQLFQDMFRFISLRAEEKDIHFNVKILNSIPQKVFTDSTRLRQILTNILSNAIKFTNQGEVSARIHFEVGALCIEVEDTGIGISQAAQEKLFSAFVQADSSITRTHGGTGLGLALARNIARELGGDLWLERSEPGKGSVFAMKVLVEICPKSKTFDSLNSAHLMETSTKIRGSTHQYENMKILVVDDSLDNQDLMEIYLNSHSILPQFANNGKEALAVIEANSEEPFDLIFLDIQMPVMDGLTTIRTLRRQGYKGRIVALTAHVLKEEIEACLDAGFDGFSPKPFDMKDLEAHLERANFYSQASSQLSQ